MPDLSTIWFVLVGVLLVGYAILDGFDLGAGALHLFVARDDVERRTVLNAIGPVWDGNEVWLITAGGALFAAFPRVYATVFSGFYLALMLVLVALILRAVSIEFRGKETARWWRLGWDVAFSAGSAVAALLFGVALGNLLRGVAIDADGAYRGGLFGLLNPFSLAVGAVSLTLALQQGAAWLVLKTEGAVQVRARRAEIVAVAAVLIAWLAATGVAVADAPRIWDNFGNPLAWFGPVMFLHGMAWLAWAIYRRRDAIGFVVSGTAIGGLAVTVGASLYPNLVPAVEKARSLTVDNAASSDTTLSVMLIVALIGMPLVLAYTAFIYHRFRGKVRLEEGSY